MGSPINGKNREPDRGVVGENAEHDRLIEAALALYGLLCFAVVPCLVLWMNFTGVLVGERACGVSCNLLCRYFTGVYVVELRVSASTDGNGHDSCPWLQHGQTSG